MTFSSPMRELMNLWEEVEKKDKTLDQIKTMLDVNGFVLFFKMDNSLFAAPEESRVTFARIKNPDEDSPKDWADEATFIAVDLDKAVEGEKSERIFYGKDISKIKVLDREAVEKMLVKRTANPKKIKKDLLEIEP